MKKITRRPDESAADFVARAEKSPAYDSWVSSDEGQAALAEAAADAAESRRQAKNARERDRKARLRQADELNPSGRRAPKVEAKPTLAENLAETRNGELTEPPTEPKKARGGNAPIRISEKVVEIDGVRYHVVLDRKGEPSKYQTDNWIWNCPTCGKRLRNPACENGHPAVPAPFGYRAADRIAK